MPTKKTVEETGCVGCNFVRQFTPHEGGFCRVHGDIAPSKPTVTVTLTHDEVGHLIDGLSATISEFDCGEKSKGWVASYEELIKKLRRLIPTKE